MRTDNDFKLYIEVLNYSNYTRRYIINTIPSVHRDLRIHLMDEIYNLKRYLLEAQHTRGNIRIKNITEMIVTVAMLDILTSEIKEFCPNSKKYMTTSIGILNKIRNMVYAWKQNPEPNK